MYEKSEKESERVDFLDPNGGSMVRLRQTPSESPLAPVRKNSPTKSADRRLSGPRTNGSERECETNLPGLSIQRRDDKESFAPRRRKSRSIMEQRRGALPTGDARGGTNGGNRTDRERS